MDKKAIALYDDEVDPKFIQAVNVLKSKEIPKSAIKEHPGKGGKTFKYIDHIWATETLQNGLPNLWCFEVFDWEHFREKLKIRKPDGNYIEIDSRSVVARCKLTLFVPLKDTNPQAFLERWVTEVGVFEINDSMPTAMGVASAVSRGLCRCMMRMFGIGLQFYRGDEQQPTPAEAWTSLKQFALNQGSDWSKEFQQAYIDALKEKGITKENIVDKFSDAYEILAGQLGKTVKLEEMPE